MLAARGIYDNLSDERVEDAAEEELLADAYAGMNRFRDADATRYTKTVNRTAQKRGSRQTAEATENKTGPTQRYSITDIQGENGDYGQGVLLDTNIFDGVKERRWGEVLGRYVYHELAGKELTLHDESGNTETVYLARENDRVKKDGAKNSHRVLDKLAGYRGNEARARAIVQLDEVLATSKHKETTDEHSHQWLDENGWETRTTYLQDLDGNIYEATVNIADGRRGRILYDVSRVHKVDKKSGIGKNTATGESQRSRYQEPGTGRSQSEATKDSVAENGLPVKQSYSESEDETVRQLQEQQTQQEQQKLPRYVKSAAEDLRTDVMEAIGADSFHDMRAVQDAVNRMAREAYEEGEISEEARKAALDAMTGNARTVDSVMYDEYREVRSDLRMECQKSGRRGRRPCNARSVLHIGKRDCCKYAFCSSPFSVQLVCNLISSSAAEAWIA